MENESYYTESSKDVDSATEKIILKINADQPISQVELKELTTYFLQLFGDAQ